MGKNELTDARKSLMNTITSHLDDSNVTEVTYKIDKRKGIMSVKGKKNDEAFHATQSFYGGKGIIQKASRFQTNIDRSERVDIVKKLRKEGYTQQEIADTLGISQSQVSNILNS